MHARPAMNKRKRARQKSFMHHLLSAAGVLDVSSEAATSEAHLREEASKVGGRCRGGRRDASQGCKACHPARASIHVQAHGGGRRRPRAGRCALDSSSAYCVGESRPPVTPLPRPLMFFNVFGIGQKHMFFTVFLRFCTVFGFCHLGLRGQGVGLGLRATTIEI